MADNRVGDYPVIIPYYIQETLSNGSTQAKDISGFDTVNLKIVNADDAEKTLTGVFDSDGTDGLVNFTTASDTWTATGTAREQVQLIDTSPVGLLSTEVVTRSISEKL